jgi:hypothetical protein
MNQNTTVGSHAQPGERTPKLLPLFLWLLLALPAVVQAQFNYTTNQGTITITGYTGPGGPVIIPDTINGLPVTSIGDSAFFNRPSLTSITIPSSVTSIGDFAFFNGTSLTSVTIPNSVTSIGDDAFAFCASLTTSILSSITSIGNNAFYKCSGLTSVAIGNSLTNIGSGAFESCTSLTDITIPGSVNSIGDFAFSGCTRLSAIRVDALNSFYSSVDGVFFNKGQTALIQCPGGKAGDYTIPYTVTSIGPDAFAFCASLKGVYFKGNAPSVWLCVV